MTKYLNEKNYNFLKDNGYLIINNFLDNRIFEDILNYSQQIINICKSKKINNDNNIRNAESKDTYMSMSKSNECIFVDRRQNSVDNGMIDIFNPELSKNISNNKAKNPIILFREIVEINIMNKINQYEQKLNFSLKNTNIYEHIKTSNPRIAHFDNVNTYYKVFLFLNDVPSSHGSFYYYPKSQKNKIRNKIMSFINHKFFLKKNGNDTDINFLYMLNKAKKNLTGNKGTIVISDVSGIHGSNPVENIERKVLVQCIR